MKTCPSNHCSVITTKANRRKKNTHSLTIEIPITPDVDWPLQVRRYSDCTPQQMKRRSLTYPPQITTSPSPRATRPRFDSGISLGSLSRGGEAHGEEVEVLLVEGDTPS